MSVSLLLAGVGIGLVFVACLSFALGPCETDPAWRGTITAVGAGIVLSALLDLVPTWLEMVISIGESGLNLMVAFVSLSPTAGGIIRSALVQVIRLVGILIIFFLYLKSSALPLAAEGDLQRAPENSITGRPNGRRIWLTIPAATQADWISAALVGLGLAMHNFWLGQVRVALIAGDSNSTPAVSLALGLVGTLGSVALIGLLAGPTLNRGAVVASALMIGMAVAPGGLWPQGRDTLLLGAFPITVATLVLPVALGRMLRRIQRDIGLGWRSTIVVLAALLITRLIDRLVLSMAQGAM